MYLVLTRAEFASYIVNAMAESPYLSTIRALVSAGYSQRAVAKMLGVPRSSIGRWLRGENHPSRRSLLRIQRGIIKLSPSLKESIPKSTYYRYLAGKALAKNPERVVGSRELGQLLTRSGSFLIDWNKVKPREVYNFVQLLSRGSVYVDNYVIYNFPFLPYESIIGQLIEKAAKRELTEEELRKMVGKTGLAGALGWARGKGEEYYKAVLWRMFYEESSEFWKWFREQYGKGGK